MSDMVEIFQLYPLQMTNNTFAGEKVFTKAPIVHVSKCLLSVP